MVALAGDRFVIRDETNRRTLGGGVVLNPLGRRVRKPLETYLKHLDALGRRARPGDGRSADRFAGQLRHHRRRASRNCSTRRARGRRRAQGSPLRQALARRRGGLHDRGQMGGAQALRDGRARGASSAEPLSPGLEMEALRERLPYEVARARFARWSIGWRANRTWCARKACCASSRIGSSSAATRASLANG